MTPIKVVLAALAISGFTSEANAQSWDDLKNDKATPGDVLTYGMGHDLQRFSELNQINTDNVSSLVPMWAYSLNDDRGQESFPIIHEGTMYVTTHNSTMAIDALTGRQKWKMMLEYSAEVPRVACCGIVNRGVAIWDGKIYRTTLDAHVMAMDAETGEEVWKTKSIDYNDGYSMTVTPLVVDGVVIAGISGGEYGIRGYIEGYDAMSGERLWRTYTVPEPGEPGSETWPEGDAWTRGGGPAWLTGSYDPELNLVYWGTGNAGPWNAGVRPGDNLYTNTILALDPKTGEIKWHYQTTPNDPFDYDATNELILADMDGQKVLMQANRNGFLYVLDRTNGKVIAANKFVDRVDWADSIDLETGRPVTTAVYDTIKTGEPTEFWPSAFGGKNWAPSAFSPDTGNMYINTFNVGMTHKAVEPQYRAGVFYFGVEWAWNWPEGERGSFRSVNPMTGDVAWEVKSDMPRNAGVLATAGGLVFTGALTGEFEAFDAASGDKLWEFQTGSGIVGQPITWEHDGTQYITIVNGGGAVYGLFSGDPRLAAIPPGGSVWTFKLAGE